MYHLHCEGKLPTIRCVRMRNGVNRRPLWRNNLLIRCILSTVFFPLPNTFLSTPKHIPFFVVLCLQPKTFVFYVFSPQANTLFCGSCVRFVTKHVSVPCVLAATRHSCTLHVHFVAQRLLTGHRSICPFCSPTPSNWSSLYMSIM